MKTLVLEWDFDSSDQAGQMDIRFGAGASHMVPGELSWLWKPLPQSE